ncbi:MAG: glutamine--fructose-6-phosphate transaminase (isomerizing) [Candidatus Latescibacteria bacterium]|nr:glutamine--fructose-6-phosphate transaminase (isomerizing) [Candidatus Latescibacterota bacterium]
MCGIFGYTGKGFTPDLLVDGIRRLEYRGYDSWGIALGSGDGLHVHRASGRIADSPPDSVPDIAFMGGIAHTRWATHGEPTVVNAHPHCDNDNSIAIVHNGIVENYRPLREKLARLGHTFSSDTDSEVIALLIAQFISEGWDLRLAFLEALHSIEGSYGIALVSRKNPGEILAARLGSPLVLGQGEGFTVVASDAAAIIPYTRSVVYLDDGECASLRADGFESFRLDDTPVMKEVEELNLDLAAVELGGYGCFMEKEIHEQPQTIQDTLRGRIDMSAGSAKLGGIDDSVLLRSRRIRIVACGTSWHAGLIGKYMFESMAGVPTDVSYAAEFRYAQPVIEPDTLVIAVSQSGETADSLAAIREAKRCGVDVMGIVNVVASSIARECGQGVFLHAGPEIGVASTKAFTSQVVAFTLLALKLSQLHNRPLRERLIMIEALRTLGELAERTLLLDSTIRQLALEFAEYSNVLYIGRLYEYPLALEGALKLKEISYIHAEGIPAAELKHGPIALVDKNMPVVVCAAQTQLVGKMISNVNEIKSRGGRIIALVRDGEHGLDELAQHVIRIPEIIDPLVPVLGIIPLQLLSYHVATARGCDVDRPRNLAKSVTVE